MPAACWRSWRARSWHGPARSGLAIVTFEDAGNGKTAYKAVALHKNANDRDTHEQMGFQDGWGTTAKQLEELAKALSVNA